MASIYDSTVWTSNSGPWTVGQIFLYLEKYYYCTQAHTAAQTPAADSQYWGGYKSMSIGGVNKPIPHFYWVPSYAPSISSEPKVRSIKFGDGYEQRTPEGINNDLLSISLGFDNRKETEATEIAHFLHIRKAHEAFAFLPPKPYSSMKRFVCRKWDLSVEFEGTYSLKATFEEVAE
jgi:phage-related protein